MGTTQGPVGGGAGGPRVGLVLGSGGLAGTAFHAGVITALHREWGWDARTAEVLVGTSAGSTSASLLRAGLPPEDFLPRMTGEPLSAEGARIMAGMPPALVAPARASAGGSRWAPASPGLLARAARRPWTVRPGAWVSALLPEGRVGTEDMRVGFAGVFEDSWPDEALWICAVRLDDGARVVFGRDDVPATVGEAVASSCAIPGYFAPVVVDGHRYVDGGVHSFCNADVVSGLGLDAVVISAPMSTSDLVHASRDHVWRSVARAQLAAEVRRILRSGTPVLVLHPAASARARMSGGTMDAGRRPDIARETVETVTAELRAAHGPVRDLLSAAR